MNGALIARKKLRYLWIEYLIVLTAGRVYDPVETARTMELTYMTNAVGVRMGIALPSPTSDIRNNS